MTTHASQYSRAIQVQPRQVDRRKATALKGLTLFGGLGLVLNERRSHRERRRIRRAFFSSEPPCALLQRREGTSHTGTLFRGIRLQWGMPSRRHGADDQDGNLPGLLRWRHPSTANRLVEIGAWLKRCLGHPWRG